MLQNFVYVRYAPGFEGTPVTNSVLLRIECNLGSGSVSTAGLDFVVTRVNQVEYVKTTASTEVYKHANINKEVRDMLSYGANKTVATVVNEAVVAGNNHTSEYGVEGCNSASWTQKDGYQCLACSAKTFSTVPASRIYSLGFQIDNNTTRSRARIWQDWVNLRFKAKTAEDLDGLKERVCPKCPASARGRLRHLDFVLDRLPPYLVVSWEFDVLAKRVRDSIFDDLDITVSNPWRQDPETRAYRWAGLVQHESRNHFRLYWRRDETSAWSYDGFAQGLTTVPM